MNPVSSLLRSRKFLLLCLDTIISLILFFIGKYATPSILEDVRFLIGIMQPVFATLIIAIAIEDAAEKRAGGKSGEHTSDS
jgi:hypothetical protein